MKYFYLFIVIFFIYLLNAKGQNFIFTKTIKLDSAKNNPETIIMLIDGNKILISGSYQFSVLGACNLFAHMTDINGGNLWTVNINRPDVGFVNDVYENEDGYHLISANNIKLGKYMTTVIGVSTIDLSGLINFDKLDSGNNAVPYFITTPIKINNGIINLSTINIGSSKQVLAALYYDLQANYSKTTILDTLAFPNIQYIGNEQISKPDSDIAGFSFSTLLNDNTTQIRFYIVDSNRHITNRFSLSSNFNNLSFGMPGPFIRTKSGTFVLSGRFSTNDIGNFILIRSIDSAGNTLWDDTLKGPYSPRKIMEDDDGNILICGGYYNKPDTDNIKSLYFNFLAGFSKTGEALFKYIWGDSSINQSLNGISKIGKEKCIVSGGVNNELYYAIINYSKTNVFENLMTYNISPFELIPNPASDFISISFTNDNLALSSISIFNSLGFKIKKMEENELMGKKTINISTADFPIGKYYCTISGKDYVFTKGFIVLR